MPGLLDEPLPERRGYLLNEYTGSREYFVLRGGVVRIRPSPRARDTCSVYLAHGSTVTLLANNVLELSSRVPYVQEFMLGALNEKEAEGWHDAIQASIRGEQAKMQRLTELLENGCTMHKYNYSNSKRSRRYFWVDDEGRELCWGRSKGEDTQKVNLRECIGIIYGPMTTTFQRCTQLEDPSWTCFSLLFMGRTLDLTVAGDLQVHAWFLGMQHLISRHGIGSMPMMSDAQFIARKVQYKLTDAAHSNGLVLGRYLIQQVRALAVGKGLGGLGRGAVVAGGRLATPFSIMEKASTDSAPLSSSRSGGAKKDKRRDAEGENGTGHSHALQARVLQLQAALRERCAQAKAAERFLRSVDSTPAAERRAKLDEAVREAALKAFRERCGELEREAQQLQDGSDQTAAQVKAGEKTEKSARKLEKKFEESEAQRVELEREVKSARASAEASSGAVQSSSMAEEEAKERSRALQARVEELERQLQEAQHGNRESEAEAAKNREQDEAIVKSEQERLALHQRLEATRRDHSKAKEAEEQSRKRLAQVEAMNSKLDSAVEPLKKAQTKLKEEQRRALDEVKDFGRAFGGEIQNLMDNVDKMGTESKSLEEKYKAAMEDRKKLHNMVLDLKGNIRVFVRVRPINAKESPTEPEGEPTVSAQDDVKIGIYDGTHSRRKWFEFDQVFPPGSMQNQVFEEAKPLVTSALDGYNVCVFAYGQTGSGKTHTMTGIPQDPGLNTRVLTELFQIKTERSSEYDISISMSVTEIYNETIRDLLAPSAKKLDVKLNQDGTCEVPGLTIARVNSVDEVLKCIGDAHKNRAVSNTDMNEQSSRSHSIVTVRTTSTLRGADTFVGKIHLIDLAGSENVGKSGVSGQGMREAQNINKSLSALGDVIASLVAKNPHTPYRNSKLTMMLKDSLGGDSKTLMIVCASPAQTNVTETLSSLNFASRARNVELGKAKRNTA